MESMLAIQSCGRAKGSAVPVVAIRHLGGTDNPFLFTDSSLISTGHNMCKTLCEMELGQRKERPLGDGEMEISFKKGYSSDTFLKIKPQLLQQLCL